MSYHETYQQLAALRQRDAPTLSKRYNLFPIQDEIAYKFHKQQETAIWSANEMDFIRDRPDYNKLHPKLRRVVDLILGFFAPGDGLITENIVYRFLHEATSYEEKQFFIDQLFIESVHAETYGLMITTLIPDPQRQLEILTMVDSHPAMTRKAQWIENHIFADTSRAARFVAFACAEGLFFSVLFAGIFYIRSKGVMQTLTFSNEQISKDEGLHRDFGCYMYNKYKTETDTEEEAIKIISSALEVEREFIKLLIEEDPVLGNLTVANMEQYLLSIANNLLMTLGYSSKPEWAVKNPFTWMDDISLTQKGNFYEVRIGSYKQASLKEVVDWRKRTGQVETTENISDPTTIDF